MLHPWIHHILGNKIARSLSHIFNNSIKTGIIPECWKSAYATEIHNNGEVMNQDNPDEIGLTE